MASQAGRYDPEGLAIEKMLRLDEIIRSAGGDRCEALARRAKEAPQLVMQAGLLHTLLFYLSKSNDGLLRELMTVLVGGGGQAPRGLVEECRGEGRGYTIATALLADAIRTLADLGLLGDAGGACKTISDARSIARCLKAVRAAGVELRVETLLEPYLITVKRLAEALYEEE